MKFLRWPLLGLLWFMASSLFAQYPEFEVEIKGKGTPVLLFPGFSCTSEVWDTTVQQISEQYECHVFTFAGFGNVPPVEGNWLLRIKNAVKKYMYEKNMYHTVLIGHSMGGTLALWLGLEEQSRLEKIIVVDALPAMGALMIPDFDPDYITYDNPYNQQLLKMDDVAFKNMVSNMAAFMSKNQDYHKQLTDWMVQADRKTYVYGYTDLLKLDIRKELSGLKIPVVILAATFPDKEAVIKNYKAQYTALPYKTFYYAENAAHFIMYDDPEWYSEKIEEQLPVK
ncbi:alpha/beta hydrolase [Ascidiimonas aurantiaca]|uniref:alpha/beta fold hydrolase n=1 Tax=Ascidiimonas aurantiaca TaxID=1685432 RepID=UPI0030EC4BE5